MFTLCLVARQLHSQFRGDILIGERGSETVAQGVKRPAGKHLIALALHRL